MTNILSLYHEAITDNSLSAGCRFYMAVTRWMRDMYFAIGSGWQYTMRSVCRYVWALRRRLHEHFSN